MNNIEKLRGHHVFNIGVHYVYTALLGVSVSFYFLYAISDELCTCTLCVCDMLLVNRDRMCSFRP